MTDNTRIYLSPPHMSGREEKYVQDAFDTNWIAPLGPNVDRFEEAFCHYTGAKHSLALSSGTAAIHLALLHLGVTVGDEVFVSTLTFSASVNPILYCGATPVFIDSESQSWNMDPELLQAALADRAEKGTLPKAVLVVHLYGQTADMDEIMAVCNRYNVPVIEDAAEALGATYKGKHAGTVGWAGICSFNGNKIITTSGGGMLFSADEDLIGHARKLSTQARDPAPHYQHSEVGYNYRLSNILAGVGRGQLEVIESYVEARRKIFDFYHDGLHQIDGVSFMPEAPWGRCNRWLTVMLLNQEEVRSSPEKLRLALEEKNIEARPVWKPMHLQPIFAKYDCFGGQCAEMLFSEGICLPSGSAMTDSDLKRVVSVVKETVPSK